MDDTEPRMPSENDPSSDRALGLDKRISRRDYLNSALVGSGSMLLSAAAPIHLLARDDWNGFGGAGDYGASNGNTFEVMSDGHKIRDHAYEPLPANVTDMGEMFDCVVIGGGISGLSAGLFFMRKRASKQTCLILENHAIFGGEARRNEFIVGGERLIAHQGSAMFFPQVPGTLLDEFYRSIHIDQDQFQYQSWTGDKPELPVGLTPYFGGGKTSAFFFGLRFGKPHGEWVSDPWGSNLAAAPIPEETRQELLRTREPADPGRIPKQHGDAVSRYLDSISLEQHLMETHRLRRETVRTFLPEAGGGSGLGADALSAYADYAADVLLPWDYARKAQMFPGGNAGVARHIVKAMMPDVFRGEASMEAIAASRVNFAALDRPRQPVRIRLRATVVSAQHTTDPAKAEAVRIVYLKNGKLYSVKARRVIVAGGSWTAKHIVRDLPQEHRDAYSEFHRAPCLMANVALRNWRFLYKLGFSQFQWFEGIGNYTAVRRTAKLGGVKSVLSPDSPVVLTLKILFSSPGLPLAQQVSRGRAELYSTPFRAYERKIREQLAMMFENSGFDPQNDITGVILNRWGHAYLSPQPGFFFGRDGKPAPGDFLRNHPHDRITFANSDLAGIMDHRTSILEAKRAVDQIV